MLFADSTSAFHQFTRLQSMTEWWHWLLLLILAVGIVGYVAFLYRRDSIELPRGVAWVLLLLRVVAFGGILFFFLDLEKRTIRHLEKHSRVALLVDTSQSMGLQDNDSTAVPAQPSRIQFIVDQLERGPLLADLRQKHDVTVYRFDQSAKPTEVAAYARLPSADAPDESSAVREQSAAAFRAARTTAIVGAVLLVISIAAGLVYLIAGRVTRDSEQTSWSLLFSVVLLIASVVVFGAASLQTPESDFRAVLGLRPPTAKSEETAPQEKKPDAVVDWREQLLPRGSETRIGDAVRYLVNQERGGPIAGLVLLSDGGENAGVQYTAAVSAASEAGIKVYTVGLGSDRRPRNVRVTDLDAPARVYPGDKFTLTGYVQSNGFAGRRVRVGLFSARAGSKDAAPTNEVVEDEQTLTLDEDGKLSPVRFEVRPEEEGRRQYVVRVTAPEGDHDRRDNHKTANVEVLERKNRVLLFTGGPSREYQFLRNLLFRDRDTHLDVLLQTGKPGVSQEGHVIFDFPADEDEMFAYDCIVAFDPDWLALGENEIKLLERWVAEKAGGLVVIAGPVHTPQWSRLRRRDVRLDAIRGLYPVAFFSFGSPTLNLGRFGGTKPWPLHFTREGLEAESLWLADTAVDSEKAWATFDGVFGYYAVKDPKPGARVLARFSDPDTAIEGEQPIYLASHFYGAGRVFFQASGEMWRVRAVDENFFSTYYTKLIRWVSQGRLLRDSSRGVLLVDKDRAFLGDPIVVRAILTDATHQPLKSEAVTAAVVLPDSTRQNVTLRRVQDATREGMFAAQLTALQEGDYRIEMTVPGSLDEMLTTEVRVRVPAREIERPERNDPLLKEVALKTGGEYYVGLEAAVRGAGRPALADAIARQDQITPLPGTPDKKFDRLLMSWLMAVIVGALSLEWLIRRLTKLA